MQSSHGLYRNGAAALAVGMACLLAGRSAWGVTRNYTIVQNSSTIAISGTIAGATINSQGAGTLGLGDSRITQYTGTIRTDRQQNTINTIQFLGGGSVDAAVSGNWQPLANGDSGNAAGDYGGRATPLFTTVNVAARDLVVDLASGVASANNLNGNFSLSSSNVTFINGRVAYRATGLLSGAGSIPLNQTGPLNENGNGTVVTQILSPGTLRETLTIPISSQFTIPISQGGITTTVVLNLNGTLVATADFADDGLRYWFNPGGGSFNTLGNWNPALLPGTAETAVFALGGTYSVSYTSAVTNHRLRVGGTNQVTFNLGTNTYALTNTSTSTPSVIVGATAGDNARMTLTGTGTGSTLSSVHAFLGAVAGSTGNVTVGAGSTWNHSGELSIGRAGTGSLTVNVGGDFVAPAGGITYIGYATGSSGNATVTGAGSTMTNGQLYVGRQGSGTMLVSTGALVSSTTARIGNQATGGVTVTGASTFTNTNTLFVGEQAQGTLSIQSGSILNTATTNIGATTNASTNGTVTITGSGSTWNNTGSVFVGGTSGAAGNPGVLNINSNASVTVGSTLRTWANGTVNLTSGKLKTTTLNIAQGTFSQTGGQLVVSSVSGNLSRAGGSHTPGDTGTAGLTSVSGSYTQQNGSLEIELGGASLAQFDRLSISGTANLAGTLNVWYLNDFLPVYGDSFQIISATGGIPSTFTTHNLPGLTDANLEWLINYTATSLTLAVGLKGDFNRDGLVDAADYVVWRDTSAAPAQYDLWRAQFGADATPEAASFSTAAVPEPASWVLFAVASVALFGQGMTRRRNV